MSDVRTIDRATLGWVAVLTTCLALSVAALGAARDSAAAIGPLPVAGVAASAQSVVSIGPGVAVIVCHGAVDAHVLGIPIVVRADELGVFLASHPGDYVGACRPPEGSRATVSTGVAVPGRTAVEAGLLDGIAGGIQIVVCASGDGQLFLTPDAAAALVRADAGVTFGSCAAPRGGGKPGATGGATSNSSGGTAAKAGSALFVDGRVSVPASSLSCGDRLMVTRVATTPRIVRTKNAKVTARFVIVNDQGHLVRGATVWMRSAPLGYVGASPRSTTATDGSVRFSLTTTKRLPLEAGGRLVMFVRATLPGRGLVSCVTGRRLISVRVSAPQS